jgi:DNA-directed RNA polymerase omega subunit
LKAAMPAEEICRKMDNKGPAIDSKFRRVLVAANRAEQLMRGARAKVEAGKRKPTRIAMEEIDHSLIEWGYGPPPQPAPAEAAPAAPADGSATEQTQPAEVH